MVLAQDYKAYNNEYTTDNKEFRNNNNFDYQI